MTSCVVVGAIVVSCVIDPVTRPSSAEAVRILRADHMASDMTDVNLAACGDCDGPRYNVVVSSSPTAGPFGEFPAFPPARRLDGTPFTQPPWRSRTHVGRNCFSCDRPITGFANAASIRASNGANADAAGISTSRAEARGTAKVSAPSTRELTLRKPSRK